MSVEDYKIAWYQCFVLIKNGKNFSCCFFEINQAKSCDFFPYIGSGRFKLFLSKFPNLNAIIFTVFENWMKIIWIKTLAPVWSDVRMGALRWTIFIKNRGRFFAMTMEGGQCDGYDQCKKQRWRACLFTKRNHGVYGA